ncbi:MAG: hypothetical protein E6H63_17600 [Betaproteobacteria bacterium]|nr:MAG: hypothetical protein E6H63_17600 [Betaproteobacteria bacterium]
MRDPRSSRLARLQRGLGTFGTLVALAIVIGAGYYAYKHKELWMAADEPPSCKAALNSCVANCRKTNTEAPDVQACQERCARDAEACEQKRR